MKSAWCVCVCVAVVVTLCCVEMNGAWRGKMLEHESCLEMKGALLGRLLLLWLWRDGYKG